MLDQVGTESQAAGATVLDGIRRKVFVDRYSLKDQHGRPTESGPEDMWRRVARGIAEVETTDSARAHWEEQFFNIMLDFKFVPGGRILAGAGSGHAVTFYNCYVIPSPEDSRSGILDNLKIMTEIMARGGGVGINLSTLRPRGSYIKTVNGTASGPCSWAELYSVATGDVIQQGGSRRGALMLMLDDDHPDIEEFITAKRIDPRTNRPVAIEHANVSVAVSSDFMAAVKSDGDWQLQFPTRAAVKADPALANRVVLGRRVRARDVWDQVCASAWATAEPGVVFLDRYNEQSNTWYYENIRCVNPCGEQGLPDWGVCNLGALNLASFVRDGAMDWEELARVSGIAMRFLDNVIDANLYFIEENRTAQMGTRRTGLGTMGLADAFIKLGVRYGSEESLQVGERVYQTIRDAAYSMSADIAAEKGTFPFFDREKYSQGAFIRSLPVSLQEKIARQGIRNAVLLTQAPTGTTSLLAGVSSGIEPVFDFAMVRRDRTGEHTMYHPLLAAWREAHPGAPVPPYFVGVNDLTPEDHVRVQAMVQRYTDSSISKTVNAPNSHGVEEVKNLYISAYDQGCKGVTYYRDGSRDAVLTHLEAAPTTAATTVAPDSPPAIRARPAVLHGYTRNIKAPEGTVNITVNSDDDGPVEVFVNVGRAGSDVAALAEALGRLVSLTLRIPSPLPLDDRLREVVSQLRGIGGSRSVGFGPEQVRSLPDAVGKALGQHLDGVLSASPPPGQLPLPALESSPGSGNGHAAGSTGTLMSRGRQMTGNLCLSCGSSTLVYEEGCKKCFSCGYSEC